MTRKRIIQVIVGILVGVVIAVFGMRALESYLTPRAVPTTTTAPAPTPASAAHLTATLFYAAADGQALVPVKRDVPFAEGVVAQGKEILTAELQAAPAPYVSVIPMGTMLRAFYVTDRGDAFIDLSPEVSKNHPGGTSAELLTVYALVNAVTANLPAVQRVQILVNGTAVDTIAGHVDVRRPLQKDTTLVRQ